MNHLSSKEVFDAFEHALEVSSRWPRLLRSLGFDMSVGRPGPLLLNNALEYRGFRRVVDEADSLRQLIRDYPDAWWFAVAQEVTGRRDATVQQVVDVLAARQAQHAAQ